MQPHNREHIGDRMKLHLRVRRVAGQDWRLLTLRPGLRARVSSNHFHDTWHLLGDARAGRLLGHLLWGLAFQRRPRTVILLDAPHLVATPFEADPALPVLLVNHGLGVPDARACQGLLRAARSGEPDRSVRWRTWGLEEADKAQPPWWRWRQQVERVRRAGGLIRWVACADALRMQARACVDLNPMTPWGSTYFPTDNWQGEVQLFKDFHRMCSVAKKAAREIDERRPELTLEARQRAIWERTYALGR
ncbi:MAG: hypothetical protein H6741_07300 [Alphaproteobacteria bacterium]|nr:hypothetical protein [Alphaproteobacteria bacterium]